MKGTDPDIAVLIAQAKNTLEIINQNRHFYLTFKSKEFSMLGQGTTSAMVLSQVFVDFYTCAETFLFRVSQKFENNLQGDKWHKDLLQKMALNISGIRPAVISVDTMNLLNEILMFRHFRRYYFDYHYDWEKLSLIESKYNQALPLLTQDINRFIAFLQSI